MKNLYCAFAIMLLFGCSPSQNDETALSSINAADMAGIIEILASDSFQGRMPFTQGEELTIRYLEKRMKETGLEPVFDTSYIQEVNLMEIQTFVNEPVSVRVNGKALKWDFPDDIAIESQQAVPSVEVSDVPLVFAGFGIVAPEYDWNDYRNLDVKGKTVVVLVNDPGLYTLDSTLFRGRSMTWYGRWVYKMEEARRQGAAGILIVHETLGAGYPFTIPRKSALSSSFHTDNRGNPPSSLLFQGWITDESAGQLFSQLGLNTDTLRKESCQHGFSGFDLNASISMKLHNTWSYNTSRNVAGLIKGSVYPDECIVYAAHWDHFGTGEPENGDSIYNGAVDNGTSLAWMLEIAGAFTSLKSSPQRSIVFLAPTAEEQGLLGSDWYVENAPFKPEKTLVCINNDLMLPIGRMRDLMVTGHGQSNIDSLLGLLAAEQDRYVLPDPNAHTGMYFRSDHFSFARRGIPAVFARGNCESREHGKVWAAEKEKDYIENYYHRPADNYYPETWDLSGIVEDAKLAFRLGYILSSAEKFPQWNEKSEFAKLRKPQVSN
jgi:Zn-dependent M28 family amino/carboxypeptidase